MAENAITVKPNIKAAPVDPRNSEEIKSLTAQSDNLAKGINNWNSGYIIVGTVGVIVALSVLGIQWWIITKGRELANVQNSLLGAKDRQLKIALDQKDEDIAAIEKEASEANDRAAKATKAAEDEKIERLKLEAQIQPREYTPEQRDAIVEACKHFPGSTLVIRSMPYDVEGAIFATSLAELLQQKTSLKLQTDGIGNNFMQNLPMLFDVHVIGPATEKNLVSALARALATPRVVVSPLAGTTPPGTHTTVLVGAKRLGPRPAA